MLYSKFIKTAALLGLMGVAHAGGVRVGDRVCVSGTPQCGACYQCLRGRSDQCAAVADPGLRAAPAGRRCAAAAGLDRRLGAAAAMLGAVDARFDVVTA